jgi:uncharacterized protein YvpB/LysM repeat protein
MTVMLGSRQGTDRPGIQDEGWMSSVDRQGTRGGLVDLYAVRLRQHGSAARTDANTAPVGTLADRRPPVYITRPHAIGRGTTAHARALRPGRRSTYRRLRLGGRVAGPRAVLLAMLAALVLLLGMAGTTLAQERYVVQDGDTLDSVATTFGVDPAAIAASSYMPDGDTLMPGQVIIIPNPGQSPSEAAQDAYAREGTSPWVQTAYVVESGDNVATIATLYGVSAESIIDLNGISAPYALLVGTRLLIPSGGKGDSSAPASAGPEAGIRHDPHWVNVDNVPTHAQEHNLSCEYAAAYIATSAFGTGVSESTFISNIGLAKNPHYGYRGNIDGPWGGVTDYGIYPEAMVPVLSANGFGADVFYSEGDTSQLKREIDAGNPVLVWLGMWGNTRQTLHDQDTYTVAAGDHVMVAFAYDQDGVYLSDPAHGEYKYYDWDTFVWMWKVLDGMSMAVYPA